MALAFPEIMRPPIMPTPICGLFETFLKTLGPLNAFVSAGWIRLLSQFFRDISAILVRSKIISPLNSANLSMSDRMDQRNFRNTIFSNLGFPNFELLTSDGLRPQKARIRSIRFPSAPYWFAENFFLDYAQDRGNFAVFIWLRPRWKLLESFTTAKSANQTHTCFPLIIDVNKKLS